MTWRDLATRLTVVGCALLLLAGCSEAGPERADDAMTPRPNSSLELPARKPDLIVATDGKDGALPTIQQALDTVKPGQSILVRPGEYVEDLIAQSGGQEGREVVIYADEAGAVIRGTMVIDAPHVDIERLEFDGSESPAGYIDEDAIRIRDQYVTVTAVSIRDYRGWGVHFELGSPAERMQASHGIVRNSYIYNSFGGVVAMGESLIVDNEIERINRHGSEDPLGDAFRVFGSNTTFRGNFVHGSVKSELSPVHADMIQSWDDVGVPTRNILVEGNTFSGWYNQGILLENDYYGVDGDYMIADWIVRNNIFQGFDSWGIMAGKERGGVPNMVVENNVFDGFGDGAYYGVVYVGSGGSGTAFNNIIGNTTLLALGAMDGAAIVADYNLVYESPPLVEKGEHDIFGTTPAFRDRSELDYRLRELSAAIDAGTATSASVDLLGIARPLGDAYDIGAFER